MGDEKKRIEGENERGKLWWWGEVAPVSVLRYINYRGREGEEGGGGEEGGDGRGGGGRGGGRERGEEG